MLNFVFYSLQINKLKIFRWKLLHYILPCKQLLYIWKLKSDDQCHICNQLENYEHFFITCKYFQTFWKKVKVLLVKLNMGTQIITYKNLILGYKVYDKTYYDINLFLTVLMFSIHKSTYASEYKQHNVDVYRIFKLEFKQYFESMKLPDKKTSRFLNDVYKNI